MNDIRSKKSFYLLTYLFILTIALSGCDRGSRGDIADIMVDVTISPSPPAIGNTTINLALSDADNQPIAGADIELEGNMSHAGMVPVFSQATEVEPGRYEASLEFSMAGDWFLLVKVTLPDGRTLERQVDLPAVETR